MEPSLASDESKVLLIYTGGTIGMLIGEHGYVPVPYFLTETLRSQARFHDPLQDTLFSHASSVQVFRQWSSSGRSSPISTGFSTPLSPVSQQPTLLVRSSRTMEPAPSLAPVTAGPPRGVQPHSRKISDNVYEAHVPALVTPRSVITGGIGKRIRYAVLEVVSFVALKHFDSSLTLPVATAPGQQQH
jgi:lysophospholipase